MVRQMASELAAKLQTLTPRHASLASEILFQAMGALDSAGPQIPAGSTDSAMAVVASAATLAQPVANSGRLEPAVVEGLAPPPPVAMVPMGPPPIAASRGAMRRQQEEAGRQHAVIAAMAAA